MQRRGFLKTLSALPLLRFLRPKLDEDAIDAKAAREALADPMRFKFIECTTTANGPLIRWEVYHSGVVTEIVHTAGGMTWTTR